LEGLLNEAPIEPTPAEIERDFFELVYNPQQEALLKIDLALDALAAGSSGSSRDSTAR
jgi:hypothetical protein